MSVPKGKTSTVSQPHIGSQQQQQPRHHTNRYQGGGGGSGHQDFRIPYGGQQIPPRQHSPATQSAGAPHDLNKGQQPQVAHTPPQSVTAPPQPQAGVVPGTQPPSMMNPYQQHRQQQPFYQPRQQRPGLSMQRAVPPQPQMYSTSPAAAPVMQQQTHPQYQQAIYIPQTQQMNNPGLYSVSTEEYSMYMTGNSGPTVWTASNFPRHAYQQQVPQGGGQYITPSTPPYYTQSTPGPNPAGAGYYPAQQQQPMPQVQYRQPQQAYTQPMPTRQYEKPPQREKKLIRITDPNKGVDITDEIMKSSSATSSSSTNITPPLSGRSSTSGTPPQVVPAATPPPQLQQPQQQQQQQQQPLPVQPQSQNSIAAQFAAQVAATLGPATDTDTRTAIAPVKPVAVTAAVPEQGAVTAPVQAPVPVPAVVEQAQTVPATVPAAVPEAKQDLPICIEEPQTVSETTDDSESADNDIIESMEVVPSSVTATESAQPDLQQVQNNVPTKTEEVVVPKEQTNEPQVEIDNGAEKTVEKEKEKETENVKEKENDKTQIAAEEVQEQKLSESVDETKKVVSDTVPKVEITVDDKQSEETKETQEIKETQKTPDVKVEEKKIEVTTTEATAKDIKKKTTKQRMKELNKKGTEEADLMEAFKDKEEPASNSDVNVTKNEDEKANDVDHPPTNDLNNLEKTEEEKKNEENEQKSKEEEESIDNREIATDPKENKIELKYKYREDQWSPVNPEGKRQYDRDFLLQFQFEANCIEKPEGLPKISDVILDTVNTKPTIRPLDAKMMGMVGPKMDFMPNYMSGMKSGMKPGMTPGGPRGGQRRQSQKEPRKIISSASLGTEVKLRTTENAWKPAQKKTDAVDGPAKTKTEELYKKVTSILNKLTPQKFQTLTQQVMDLPIDTEDKLKGVIDLVFEKAISEPGFSVAYANMCRCLMSIKVPTEDGKSVVNFRKLLLIRCQKEFEKSKEDNNELEAKRLAAEAAEAGPEKNRLHEEYEFYETKMRRRSLGNIRFIGELFKLKMLTEPIMHDCVVKLLKAHDEDSLECLCRLITTIGKDLDHEKAKPRVDQYFTQMEKIVKGKKHSSRVRFMLQDVIELRQNKWVPRRDENNPKTIEQIHKEAKLEAQQQHLLLQQQPIQSKRPRGRGSDRGSQGGQGGQVDDGWSMVSSTKSRPSLDPNKFKVTKQPVDENIQLGPGGRPGVFGGGWGRGSSGGSGKPQTDQQESRPAPGNRFQALASGDSQVYDSSRRGSRGELGRGRESKGRQLGGPRRSSSRESARDGRNREREEAIAAAKNLTGAQALAERERERERVKTPEPRPATPAAVEPPKPTSSITEEAMEKKSKAILDEFMHLRDAKEAKMCITELNATHMLHVFVRMAVENAIDRSEQAREAVGTLLYDMIREDVMTVEHYVKGFGEILEFADDMAIDIPKFWTYLGELISPLIVSGKVPMTVLRDVTKPLLPIDKAAHLTAEVLLVASKNVGKTRIEELWHTSGMDWSGLLPSGEDLQDFLDRKGLQFTSTSSTPSPSSASPASDEGMPTEKIQQHLEHLLLREKAVNDKIFDWIEANVSVERRKESDFIRALMTAVCQSAVSGEGSACRCEINEVKNRASVLQKYLDNDDKLELQALYALQALNFKLDSPPSLLRIFFDKLYDEDVISEEAFYAWESSNDPNEQQGKGVALKSVTAFFTWLREADDDSGDQD
ncbi:eukaryotic translation initiation factor 4 gamma 3-like isoform X2 [Glandiceps talaboti]